MYSYVQDVPIGEEIYAKIRDRLGSEPIDGLVAHIVVRRDDGNLRYVDVWQSKEACDAAFETRIHPAVFSVFHETGFQPKGEPKRDDKAVVDVMLGVSGKR